MKKFFFFTFSGQFQSLLKSNNIKELSDITLKQDIIFEGSSKLEVIKMCIFFLYASMPISKLLDKIRKRTSLSFNLAQKTPFIEGMVQFLLNTYKQSFHTCQL